jgi:hypothetical protein
MLIYRYLNTCCHHLLGEKDVLQQVWHRLHSRMHSHDRLPAIRAVSQPNKQNNNHSQLEAPPNLDTPTIAALDFRTVCQRKRLVPYVALALAVAVGRQPPAQHLPVKTAARPCKLVAAAPIYTLPQQHLLARRLRSTDPRRHAQSTGASSRHLFCASCTFGTATPRARVRAVLQSRA